MAEARKQGSLLQPIYLPLLLVRLFKIGIYDLLSALTSLLFCLTVRSGCAGMGCLLVHLFCKLVGCLTELL